MGDHTFAQMTNQLVKTKRFFTPLIFEDDYEQWKKEFTFDSIKNGVRYGQSFCNTFDLTDNILYYERDHANADARIKQLYVA